MNYNYIKPSAFAALYFYHIKNQQLYSSNFLNYYHIYLALALILRRFLWRRRVLFFFHFQRILAVDFLK